MRVYFIIVVSFVLFCCSDKRKRLDYFEMSYSDGWLSSYSFAIEKNRKYYLEKQGEVSKGELSEKEFKKLGKYIFEIKNAKLKSHKSCCDGVSFSLIIKSNSETIKIVQQKTVDGRIIELSKKVEEILSDGSNQTLDAMYDFKTKSDLISQLKLLPIPN